MPDNLLDTWQQIKERKATSELEDMVLDVTSARDLVNTTPEEPDWLVPRLLAPGWALMVSAREKTGKGTLIAYLLGRLEAGEATVFGDAYPAPVTALVFTEEPTDSMAEKARDAGLNDTSYVFGWELPPEVRLLPTKEAARWRATCKVLANTARARGHEILFVDNVSRAAGIEDEGGTELARAIEVLAEESKRAELTLIVDHHHRKSGGDIRDRSRGGTAAAGAVDVALSMDRGKNITDRKRPLTCIGRRKATVWARTIELSEDGRDYSEVEGTEADGADHSASMTEHKRLDILRALSAQKAAAGEDPWMSVDAIAEAWDMKRRSAANYLRDRVPQGEVLAEHEVTGPGRPQRYAAPGWETADTQILAAVSRPDDSPDF